MRLIDADVLYKQLQDAEELARNRVLDTESSLPFPTNQNPSYTRYSTQLDERTRLKHMVADAPTISPQPHWTPFSERPPKQGQEVICQCRASIIKVLKLDANGDWYQDAEHCYMSGFVIAWMPLPDPYRAERRTDE